MNSSGKVMVVSVWLLVCVSLQSSYTWGQPCVPVPPGLVSWWPGDGNADDLLGTNPGTLEGGTGFAAGKVITAFSFDGVDDYVNVPDSASLDAITSAITVETWIKPETSDSGGGWFFSRRNPLGSEGFGLFAVDDGTFAVSVGHASGTSTFFSAAGVVQFGTFQHVAATADTSTGAVKFFVNGVEILLSVSGPSVITGPLTGANNLYIGRRQTSATGEGEIGASHFKGLVDEVELYDRALTPGEILAIFLADSSGKCKGVSDPENDAPDEIDVTLASLSQGGSDVSCMLTIASDTTGLKPKTDFKCHIDFDDEESEAEAGKGASGCDSDVDVAGGDGDFEDFYRLGDNGVCTTSDLTMAYRIGRRGGLCTGLPSIICSEEETDVDGDIDNDCDGDVGGDDAVFCKITLTGDVEDIADAWDAQCEDGNDECLTTVSDKLGNGEFEVLVFWQTKLKKDRDRVPDTDDNQKPNEAGEVEMVALDDPTP